MSSGGNTNEPAAYLLPAFRHAPVVPVGAVRRPRRSAPGRRHACAVAAWCRARRTRSEEHTSELQSLMRISYAVFCLKKKKEKNTQKPPITKSTAHISYNTYIKCIYTKYYR